MAFRVRLKGRSPVFRAALREGRFPFLRLLRGPPERKPPTYNFKLRVEEAVILALYYWYRDEDGRIIGYAPLFFRVDEWNDAVPVEPVGHHVIYSEGDCELGVLIYPADVGDTAIPVEMSFNFNGEKYVNLAALVKSSFVRNEEGLVDAERAERLLQQITSTLSCMLAGVKIEHVGYFFFDDDGTSGLRTAALVFPGASPSWFLLLPSFFVYPYFRLTTRLFLARRSGGMLQWVERTGKRTDKLLSGGFTPEVRIYESKDTPYAVVVEREDYVAHNRERFTALVEGLTPEELAAAGDPAEHVKEEE